MAINLGAAYVDIVPSTANLAPQLQRQIDRPLADSGTRAGRGFGNRFVDGLTGFSTGITRWVSDTFMGAATVAATGVASVLGLSLVTGFSRFTALENANRMLVQLGLEASNVDALMGALNDTLTGTAFSLDEGAGALTRLVSAGVPLGDIPGILDSIADAAAFGQSSMEEVGLIFSRIASQGRVTAQELNMLTDRNIPAFELLASAMGLSVEALRDLVSSGELDAETFFRAWEEGARGFGESGIIMEGAALSMGDTTQGALSNLRAAIARFGANAFAPIFEAIRPVADSLRGLFDEITPRVRDFIEGFVAGDSFQGFLDFMGDLPSKVGPASDVLDRLGKAAGPLAGLFGALGIAGLRALPLLGWIPALNPLVGIFAGLVAQSPELRQALVDLWEALWPLVQEIGKHLLTALQNVEPILVGLFEFLADNPGPTLAAVAVGALTVAVGLLATALMKLWANPIGLVVAGLALIAFGLVYAYQNSETFRNFIHNWVIPTLKFLWDMFRLGIGPMGVIGQMFFGLAGLVKDLAGALRDLKAAWDAVRGFLFDGNMSNKLRDLTNQFTALKGAAGATAGIPRFHAGGVVPGPRGQEVVAVLKAGETVLPTHDPSWSLQVSAPAAQGSSPTYVFPNYVGDRSELVRTMDWRERQQRLAAASPGVR